MVIIFPNSHYLISYLAKVSSHYLPQFGFIYHIWLQCTIFPPYLGLVTYIDPHFALFTYIYPI